MSDYNEYDEGQIVTITMEFKDAAGTLVDPAAITLEIREPISRTLTTYTDTDMTKDSTGEWHIDVNTLGFRSGTWFYKIYSTGTAFGAKESAFIINPTEMS